MNKQLTRKIIAGLALAGFVGSLLSGQFLFGTSFVIVFISAISNDSTGCS